MARRQYKFREDKHKRSPDGQFATKPGVAAGTPEAKKKREPKNKGTAQDGEGKEKITENFETFGYRVGSIGGNSGGRRGGGTQQNPDAKKGALQSVLSEITGALKDGNLGDDERSRLEDLRQKTEDEIQKLERPSKDDRTIAERRAEAKQKEANRMAGSASRKRRRMLRARGLKDIDMADFDTELAELDDLIAVKAKEKEDEEDEEEEVQKKKEDSKEKVKNKAKPEADDDDEDMNPSPEEGDADDTPEPGEAGSNFMEDKPPETEDEAEDDEENAESGDDKKKASKEAGFDEGKHERYPEGHPKGGQWKPKDGGEDAAHDSFESELHNIFTTSLGRESAIESMRETYDSGGPDAVMTFIEGRIEQHGKEYDRNKGPLNKFDRKMASTWRAFYRKAKTAFRKQYTKSKAKPAPKANTKPSGNSATPTSRSRKINPVIDKYPPSHRLAGQWKPYVSAEERKEFEGAKAVTILTLFESGLHKWFTMTADDLYRDNHLTREERIALSSAIGAALERFSEVMPELLGQAGNRSPYTPVGPANIPDQEILTAYSDVYGFDGPEMVKSIDTSRLGEFKPLPDVLAAKSLAPDRFGGYLILWGDERRKDVTGEWFTKSTAEIDTVFNSIGAIPAVYHHAADNVMKSTVIGAIDTMEMDSIGVWVEAQVNNHKAYKKFIEPLIEQKVLGWSSGTFPRARQVAKSGEILRWPTLEGSLTPAPAEYRMLTNYPVSYVKAAFAQAGLEYPGEFADRELSLEKERIAVLELEFGGFSDE